MEPKPIAKWPKKSLMPKRVPLDTNQFRVKLPEPKHDPLEAVIPTKPKSEDKPSPLSQHQQRTDKAGLKPTRKVTQKITPRIDTARDKSSDSSREKARGKPRELPTRDEVQEFSFRLRDDLSRKLQAEVPHQWLTELENMARDLNVKKLQLYRFIIGEFLRKVERKKSS